MHKDAESCVKYFARGGGDQSGVEVEQSGGGGGVGLLGGEQARRGWEQSGAARGRGGGCRVALSPHQSQGV